MNGVDLIRREIAGHVVRQRKDGYVNATELCKAAGKRLNHYMSNQETEKFLQVLSSEMRIVTSQLVEVRKGGSSPFDQGTWVHPRVAIDLARWCSPQFAVVVNGWVFDLMTKGQASINNAPPTDARTAVTMHAIQLILQDLLSPLSKRIESIEQQIQAVPLNSIPMTTGPLTTVKDRCEHLGWLDSNSKEREAARRLAQQLLSRHCKHGPHLLSGGNTLHFDSVQIPELDDAILSVWVKSRGERKNAPTMFTSSQQQEAA